MAWAEPSFSVTGAGTARPALVLAGAWRLAQLAPIEAQLAGAALPCVTVIDARALTQIDSASALLLLRAGYAYVPYSSLESVIEKNKEGYYLALRQTQGSIRTEAPNWQPWILFFLRALQSQMRRLATKVEREKIVLSALPELSVQILEHAREHGRVTIGEMVKLTGASRNTLKEHFRQLTEKGHLVMHGSGRGAWYSLP